MSNQTYCDLSHPDTDDGCVLAPGHPGPHTTHDGKAWQVAQLDIHEWVRYGVDHGYCSEPVCNTHDGLPNTPEEEQAWEEGLDPCVPAVRLLDA